MFTCVIIDDDQFAVDCLIKYIQSFPNLQVLGSYTDPLLALNSISSLELVDLVLMDIDMPGINGIELSKEIRFKTRKLVFTTGYSNYAYDAFKIDADDYLLKPFGLGEFMISMSKLFPMKEKLSKNEFFFVRNKEEHHKTVSIKFMDVIVIESKLNYVMIYTTTKKVLTYMTLNEISKLFHGYPNFVQFHRSFILSCSHIDYIEGNSIKMLNGMDLTVGNYYRKSFSEFVAKYILKAGRGHKST